MENNEEIVKEFPEFPLMVQYEKQILLDITENDALLVTAK